MVEKKKEQKQQKQQESKIQQEPNQKQKTKEYYVIHLPKEGFEILENLQINKNSFMKQACLFFVKNIKKEGKMDLYFTANNGNMGNNSHLNQRVIDDDNDGAF